MRFQFKIKGDLPPKKDGAQSMWGKPLEARRLEKLRRAAQQAIQGNAPLQRNIRLSLEVHVGAVKDRSTGDLDNFVTGVCDGLMAAAPGAKLDIRWSSPELSDIHPSKPLAIVDDCQVVSIQAEKIVGDSDQPWYEIILEGE